MANWKKMAEAFGRAAHGSNSDAAKYARQSYERDLRRYDKDRGAADRAEAFNRGGTEKWMDERNIVVDRDGRPDVVLERDDRVIDQRGDARTDENLQRDFSKALDEAAEIHGYNKWRNESKDMPANDGFGGSLHDVNREDAVQRSREEIIKALQQNTDRDVTDVLRDFGYIFEE